MQFNKLCSVALLFSVIGCDRSPRAETSSLQVGDVQLPDVKGDQFVAGRRLFENETFGGNGRTCLTCHSRQTGTLNPEEIQSLYNRDPHDPLFLADGSDDGAGNGVTRILRDATILITLSLPPNVYLADDPSTRTVTLRHGIPTTLNTPALDPVLMYDGREPNLAHQALGAINAHDQATIEPTNDQLELIASFEQTNQFFSSPELYRYAQGALPPTLPEGRTESEKRGRRFLEDVPFDPITGVGACALCHSGPMLNQVNAFNPLPVPPFFVPQGTRFQSILSAELLPNGDPVHTYVITQPDGSTFSVTTSDPGRALQDGEWQGFPFGHLAQFKIPTLWGISRTAPYFHNCSARTLEDVLAHYTTFFAIAVPAAIPGANPLILSEQDQADIIAYLKLL
jgi:hypothetical protein